MRPFFRQIGAVAQHAAFDLPDPRRFQRFHPVGENGLRAVLGPELPATEGRIPAAPHDQIAFENPARNGSGAEEFRGVGPVPAQ